MFWRKKKTVSKTSADIDSFDYNAATRILVVKFHDGSFRTHINVRPGYIVGLEVAADKRDYYESQIAEYFPTPEG